MLALLNRESGHQQVAGLLADGALSTVNLCEVAAKLRDKGLSLSSIRPDLLALGLEVIDFGESIAFRAAEMRPSTRHVGLSLGDRACLATAATLGAIAVTSDRTWGRLNLGVKVRIVR